MDEQGVLAFWKEHGIYEKAKRQNEGGEPFYFLDGPPYTSGKVHLGTAWNKALKDMVLRYKRMRGYDVWDRAGYDMHGLPTETATQKKLGLTTKEDIKRYGVAAFIDECRAFCLENMRAMNEDFARLGVWMDFENAYQTITPEFIDGEWWLIKQAHERGRLYEGLKTMTWCPDCASALAKHECEYHTVEEPSIFAKFPVEGKEHYLIIWTTTPWTIPFNLAIMVNPELDYVRCAVTREGRTERWILAKALAGPVIQSVANADFEIEEEFKGKQLAGLKYHHPFEQEIAEFELMREEAPKLHTVLLSTEYVDTSAGSGLVHCAPGCGPEDFEVGHRNGLPPFNTLDESGTFTTAFKGKVAKKDDAFFIEELRRKGALIESVDVEHEYPHCWRHHTPVIFRATKQWFFKVEDIKERLVEQNDGITWVPQAAYNAFDSWLHNLRDNSITKQRYWGTPLPIWRCDACGHYLVIGSREELKEHAGTLPKDVHKPHIDGVTWPCSCTGTMRRVPDVLDVWVDAGTVSWSCLDYPQEEEHFRRLFPADFILEGKDQIRGWFNLLHLCSNLAFERRCFDACYMHGHINDAQGRKMSKSQGNYILPEEVIEKYSANTFRYYAIGAANPGLDMNYNFDDVELKHRNLVVYRNLRSFILGLAGPGQAEARPGREERYILSRLHSTIRDVTAAMEAYRLNEVPWLVESLLLDLSRNYIQLVRDKAAHGSPEERQAVLHATFTTYYEAMRLFAIVAPMFAEESHQALREAFDLGESIHLAGWPEHDERHIDETLEREMALAFEVISAGLAARDAANIGLRWPLPEVVVDVELGESEELVRRQLNVKRVRVEPFGEATVTAKPDYKALGKEFGKETATVAELITGNAERLAKGETELDGYTVARHHYTLERHAPEGWSLGEFPKGAVYLNTAMTPELEREGYARELIRRIQQLRKEAGLEKEDSVTLLIDAPELKEAVAAHKDEILKRCGATSLADTAEQTKEFSLRGKTVRVGITKA